MPAATRPKRKRERKHEKKSFKVSDVTLLLPDGNPVSLIAVVTDELPNAPPMSTGEGCEMKLGVDFARRFLTIFDFAQQDVRFVELRTPEGQALGQNDTDIERDHRWWVRGHYRAQWHPSEQAHHLMWIMPHLKGPDGLPVKNPMYSVVR